MKPGRAMKNEITEVSRTALALIACLAIVSTACVSGVLGNAQSRSADCDTFQGVFRDIGRYTPEYAIGAPVPGESPSSPIHRNEKRLYRDVLLCSPNCYLGTHRDEISFALSYRSGALRWAAIHSPSGKMIVRGERPWTCEEGKLFPGPSEWASLLPALALGFPVLGKYKDQRFLIINDEGWLVSYDKNTVIGMYLVVPIFGSKLNDWMEFPPDRDLQLGVETLFEQSPARLSSTDTPAHDPSWAALDPALASPTEKQPRPSREPTSLHLRLDESRRVGDITLTLQRGAITRRKDRYYEASATLLAEQGRETKAIHLTRDHSGDDMEYVRVFDTEIALESYVSSRPDYAYVMVVLPQHPALNEPQTSRYPVYRELTLHRAAMVGDITLTLESAAYEYMMGDPDESSVTITAEKGGLKETFQLTREHPGDIVYEPVFDREIALRDVTVSHQRASTAWLLVRYTDKNIVSPQD